MADAAQAKQSGSGSRALLWLLILLLLGAVWWLASERNARRYAVSSRDGALIISRGRYFPTGTGVVGPDDAEGKLYWGIPLPPGTKNLSETEYEDQGALDRGLYQLLSANAHALAKKGDATSFADADGLAKRLQGLRGLSAEELADLTSLRAELAFWSAGGDVKAALTSLAAARRKLEEVRANGGEHATMAGPIEAELEPIANELLQAGARFAQPGAAPGKNVGTPNIGTPINSTDAGPATELPGPNLDGGAAAIALPLVPHGSDAPPPAVAPSSPPADPQQGASAPGSVRSGASRGQ
jgi:hypothetical protein